MKMKKLICLVALLLLAIPAKAAPHSVVLTFQPSSVVGVSYHVQRAPCAVAIVAGLCPTTSEGTFAVIATITALTYTDSTVTGNANYSYAVSAFCPTPTSCASNFAVNVDSPLSNHIGAAIPPDPVTPPNNLTLTSVTRNSTGANVIVAAHWTDSPNLTTSYTISSNGTVLNTGTASSTSSDYSLYWQGKTKPGAQITFKVCDSDGACATQTI